MTVSTLLTLSCARGTPPGLVVASEGSYSTLQGGEGEVTVVFESGLGGAKEAWVSQFEQIGPRARYIAYDRPRQGQSRSQNKTRDGLTLVRELHEMLRAANTAPPYLLVGASMGGTYVELYARTYPEEVAGVVLVDSRAASVTQRCEAAGSPCDPATPFGIMMAPRRFKGEVKAMKVTEAQVHAAPPFPEVPLAVVTGAKADPREDKAFVQIWLETQRELAQLSPQAKHFVCEDCGHGIQHNRPELVTEAIRWVLAQRDAATTDPVP